jgi:filamentous hemagglutinin
MHEFHEQDTGDDADTGTDSRPDAAAGHVDDSRQPAIATVRDSTTRIALALEYRQLVKEAEGAYAASGKAGAASPDDREDHAPGMPGEGDRVPGPTPGRDTGVPDDDRRGDARSQDMAWRPARGADLPASTRELPNARDVLPNLEMAEIDERKFSEYSLNPGHPDNQGKADGWRALGYDVDNPQARQNAARELRYLTLEELLPRGKVAEVRDDAYGPRPRVISGITGPNGKDATMVTCWLIENRSGTAVPRLITTWVQLHRDKETGQ